MSNANTELYEAYLKKRGQAAAPVQVSKPQIIRQSNKQPNKTEERFRLTYLESWIRNGTIDRYGEHESVTIRLANGARFSPDWPTWKDGRLTFYEVKGARIWDDAKDRLKFAPKAFPEFRLFVCQWKKGEWIIQEVLA